MSRSRSNLMFWARHIGLALALIIIAAVVINLQHVSVTSPKPQGAQKDKNPSKGLTDFYSEYRLSSTRPHQEDKSDFVMELNTPETSINERLKNMESVQKPVSGRWVGEHKYRTFKSGSTLRESITSYAQSEGMQIIWELDQDFIIKNQFQMEDTIVGSLEKISRAIDSNFDGEVLTFFCAKQRSLVITANTTDYIRKNCRRTSG